MKNWDKGIDYETLLDIILKRYRIARKQKEKCYLAILLIQLRNGARISEAVRCYRQYLKNKNPEQRVVLSKKRKIDDRLMYMPLEFIPNIPECSEFLTIDYKKLINRIKVYSIRVLKVNTHTLRYAYITYLAKKGVNPSIIAKLTKHSNLNFITAYTQEKEAQNVLKNTF